MKPVSIERRPDPRVRRDDLRGRAGRLRPDPGPAGGAAVAAAGVGRRPRPGRGHRPGGRPRDATAAARCCTSTTRSARITGYTRDEVVGRSLHFLRGPNTDPATLDRLRVALDAGHPVQGGAAQLSQGRVRGVGRRQPRPGGRRRTDGATTS